MDVLPSKCIWKPSVFDKTASVHVTPSGTDTEGTDSWFEMTFLESFLLILFNYDLFEERKKERKNRDLLDTTE